MLVAHQKKNSSHVWNLLFAAYFIKSQLHYKLIANSVCKIKPYPPSFFCEVKDKRFTPHPRSGKSYFRRFIFISFTVMKQKRTVINICSTNNSKRLLTYIKEKKNRSELNLWEMMKYRHATKHSLDTGAVINSTLKSLNSIL